MAQFLDERPDEELNEGEELASFEEPEQEEILEEATDEEADVQPVEEPEDIPEKYKGKQLKDVIQMHKEAEKLLGRQSSEVGELRKIIDEFVKTQLASNTQTSPQVVEEDVDFFDDPKLAVQKTAEQLLKDHPALKEVEELNRSLRAQQALSQVKANHPDFEDILGDDKFKQWISKSNVRMELYERADKSFDFDAADELFTSWKERQATIAETAKVHEKDRKRQVKAASSGSANGTGEASRKIYRRADIIKLMQNDPDRYMQIADEIAEAYEQGRVK
jgi:hypothetical protein